MKVKRHAKEYLRTEDDLTEVKVLRFGSLQWLNEQKVKSKGEKGRRGLFPIPIIRPIRPDVVSASGRQHDRVTTFLAPTKSFLSNHPPVINRFLGTADHVHQTRSSYSTSQS